jgi:SAM-dependent methyltransferase
MLTAILRASYHAAFRLALPLRCAIADLRTPPTGNLPPARMRFRVSESLSVPDFEKIGERCAMLVNDAMAARDITAPKRILDFGCGCGRTLRWLVDQHGDVEFHGADVDAEAIEWSRRHYPRARFAVTDPQPPLPFSSQFFDVVYCLSVFTHLNEAMQDHWLAELHRILTPGGLLLLTVHGPNAAAQLKAQIAEELAEKGFVHKRSKKLQGILPEWYHTTFHSPAYIERRLAAHGFEDIRYEVITDGIQDVVTARRGPAA